MFSLPQQKGGTTRSAKDDTGTEDSRYERSVAFCPHCYVMIAAGDASCPASGADLRDWHAKGYGARLILALNHPLADVRMRAIIALELRREKASEQAPTHLRRRRGAKRSASCTDKGSVRSGQAFCPPASSDKLAGSVASR